MHVIVVRVGKLETRLLYTRNHKFSYYDSRRYSDAFRQFSATKQQAQCCTSTEENSRESAFLQTDTTARFSQTQNELYTKN